MGTQTAAAGAAAPASGASEGHITGYATPGYRNYLINALLIIYILSFMDRALLSVVARPLKAEILISDFAFGLLTGAGFAVFYTIVGIPLARLSETKNRVWIIGISLAIWSAFTALTGLSADIAIGGTVVLSGFMMLLICRVGVGIGEAGCTPPANSLIADYYPAAKRSAALGYYAMGVTLGTTLANIVGGQITDIWGWRAAFIVMGLPGIIVAVLFVMTVKEPPRGYSESPDVKKKARAELWPSVREMFSKTSFWTMTAGATLAAFCGYAIAGFQSLYLQRTFGLSAGEASLWVNAPAYAAGAVGTVITGWLAMKMRAKSITAIAWLSAIGLAASVPFYIWGFTSTSLLICAVGLSLGHFVKYGYLAAQYTISQGVVSPTVRATSTAVMLFIINILGYGLGPPFAGILSDFVFSQSATAAGFPGFTNAGCDAAAEALRRAGDGANVSQVLAGLANPISEAQLAFCGPANSQATQTSMLVISALYAISGLCFFLCMFTLKKDMVIVQREYSNTAPMSLRVTTLALGLAGLAIAWFHRPAGMMGDFFRTGGGTLDQTWFMVMAVISALVAIYGLYLTAYHLSRKREPAVAT
jgi:MFS family permease